MDWTENDLGLDSKIRHANLDGSEVEEIITGLIDARRLALDIKPMPTLTDISITETTVLLEWTFDTSNFVIAQYEIFLEDSLIANATNTNFLVTVKPLYRL